MAVEHYKDSICGKRLTGIITVVDKNKGKVPMCLVNNGEKKLTIHIGDKVMLCSSISCQKWIQTGVVKDIVPHTNGTVALVLRNNSVSPIPANNYIAILE